MEERRMLAADLFAKGVNQAGIARELGVVHQTLSDWHEKWQTGGKKALGSAGRAGRPPEVTDADLAKEFSLLPVVRATWAPRDHTPVLRHHLNSWKRLSMSAPACFSPETSDAALVFSLRPRSCNDEAIMEFLLELHRHLGGDKVTLIWDGLPSHRSKAMQRFIADQRCWLVVCHANAAPKIHPRRHHVAIAGTEMPLACTSTSTSRSRAARLRPPGR